jgi:hypothetical protein
VDFVASPATHQKPEKYLDRSDPTLARFSGYHQFNQYHALDQGREQKVDLKITLKWLGNLVALLLLSMFAAEAVFFAAADVNLSAMQITLALFYSWLAVLLNPVNSDHKTPAKGIILWAVTAATGFLTLSSSPLYFEQGGHGFQLAGGVLILILLFTALQSFLLTYSSSHSSAMTLFTLITGTILAAPLYLGVVAEATSHQLLVDSIIAVSPVSYLAGIIDFDYLRSSWFYQHTPFSGLRFNYPATGIMTVCYVITTLVLAGMIILRNRLKLGT